MKFLSNTDRKIVFGIIIMVLMAGIVFTLIHNNPENRITIPKKIENIVFIRMTPPNGPLYEGKELVFNLNKTEDKKTISQILTWLNSSSNMKDKKIEFPFLGPGNPSYLEIKLKDKSTLSFSPTGQLFSKKQPSNSDAPAENQVTISSSETPKTLRIDSPELHKWLKQMQAKMNSNTTEQDYNKLFELNLYSDKQEYKTTDKIKIWATLKYIGHDSQIKIWYSNPYISFAITDGTKFETGSIFDDILTSTILVKNKLYKFDYAKSGGYSADDPNAEYLKKFYQEKNLYLPNGEYTVKVGGAFSLIEDTEKSKSNLIKEIKIKIAN